MKRLKRREDEKSSKKKVLRIAKFVGVILLVVFALEIWMVNRLSTYGNKIQSFKQQEAALQLENQVLTNQIAQKASLMSTEKRSTALGFDSVKSVEYLKPTNIASVF